jgi:hypothetical protein
MAERTDIGVGSKLENSFSQSIAFVTAIGQQNSVPAERAEHLCTDHAVVRLPFGQHERDREAVAIDKPHGSWSKAGRRGSPCKDFDRLSHAVSGVLIDAHDEAADHLDLAGVSI